MFASLSDLLVLFPSSLEFYLSTLDDGGLETSVSGSLGVLSRISS